MAADNEQRTTALDDAKRRALYENLRQRTSRSALYVEAPTGITPYWARKADDQELSRLDILGFSVVKEPDPAKRRYKANGLKQDGTYVLGDLILLEIPTEMYNFYESQNLDRATMLAEGAKEYFKNEAERQNVPTFEVNKPLR
jgi:hypothetical protein